LRSGGTHGEQAQRNLAVQSQTGLDLKSLIAPASVSARVGHEAELLQNDARLDAGTCAPREATQTSFAVSSSTSHIEAWVPVEILK